MIEIRNIFMNRWRNLPTILNGNNSFAGSRIQVIVSADRI